MWRKLLKVAAFVIFPTSITVLFEIHQRFKGHFLNELRVSFKVSGNPCHDPNLTSIVWKKALLQLFLYFSVQIETGNYKLIYESQFKHFIKWGKICITFSIFYGKLWALPPRGHKIFLLFLTSAC